MASDMSNINLMSSDMRHVSAWGALGGIAPVLVGDSIPTSDSDRAAPIWMTVSLVH
jgi:hypothetical protein